MRPHWQRLELDYVLFRGAVISPGMSKFSRSLVRLVHAGKLRVPYWLGQTFVIARSLESSTGRKFVRGLLLFCAAAASAVILAACGSHTTAPSPIVEQPAPQPSPQPPPPAPVPVLAVTRILAFGDSMTAGTTSPAVVPPALTAGPPQSYPAKLQDLVNGRYTGQTIIVLNAGKPSEDVTDAATLARFNHEVSKTPT